MPSDFLAQYDETSHDDRPSLSLLQARTVHELAINPGCNHDPRRGIKKLGSLLKVAAQLKRCVNGKDPIFVFEDLSQPVLADIDAHGGNRNSLHHIANGSRTTSTDSGPSCCHLGLRS